MLRIAHRDLKAARSMVDYALFDEASWGVHVQQATEKASKAWISALEHEYSSTHDLALLCRLFTAFGARPRYGDKEEPLNLDRVAWNRLCADLFSHVAVLIP
jgi:HEPN domain-containing protein